MIETAEIPVTVDLGAGVVMTRFEGLPAEIQSLGERTLRFKSAAGRFPRVVKYCRLNWWRMDEIERWRHEALLGEQA